jgi:hypothetical protein
MRKGTGPACCLSGDNAQVDAAVDHGVVGRVRLMFQRVARSPPSRLGRRGDVATRSNILPAGIGS